MVSELELFRLQCLGRPFSGMTQTTLFLNLRVLRVLATLIFVGVERGAVQCMSIFGDKEFK